MSGSHFWRGWPSTSLSSGEWHLNPTISFQHIDTFLFFLFHWNLAAILKLWSVTWQGFRPLRRSVAWGFPLKSWKKMGASNTRWQNLSGKASNLKIIFSLANLFELHFVNQRSCRDFETPHLLTPSTGVSEQRKGRRSENGSQPSVPEWKRNGNKWLPCFRIFRHCHERT